MKPHYHTAEYFLEDLPAIEMKQIKVKINKPVYLGMSILNISKTPLYELWYDYIQLNYQNNAKPCHMENFVKMLYGYRQFYYSY